MNLQAYQTKPVQVLVSNKPTFFIMKPAFSLGLELPAIEERLFGNR